jgi:hypothetical protein
MKALGILAAGLLLFLLTGLPRGPDLLILVSAVLFTAVAIITVWFLWWLFARPEWPPPPSTNKTPARVSSGVSRQ